MAIKLTENFFQMNLLSDEDLSALFCADEVELKSGIYAVPNHTDKNWFHRAVSMSNAITFMRSEEVVLFAFGEKMAEVLSEHKHVGFFVRTKTATG